MHVHGTALVHADQTCCVLVGCGDVTFESDIGDVDVAAAVGAASYTSAECVAPDGAGFVEDKVFEFSSVADCSKQTLVVLAGLENEVADDVALAFECADILLYGNEALQTAIHVDVIRQACARVLMYISIVEPPYKFDAIAYFEPSIDWCDEVLVELSADCAPAILILMVRNNGIASICVAVCRTTHGFTVATVFRGIGIDERTCFCNRHRLFVSANQLIEALQAVLLAVQEECKLTVGNACFVFVMCVLVLVGNVATCNGIDNVHIIADDVAPVT